MESSPELSSTAAQAQRTPGLGSSRNGSRIRNSCPSQFAPRQLTASVRRRGVAFFTASRIRSRSAASPNSAKYRTPASFSVSSSLASRARNSSSQSGRRIPMIKSARKPASRSLALAKDSRSCESNRESIITVDSSSKSITCESSIPTSEVRYWR